MSRTKRDIGAPVVGSQRHARCCTLAMLQGARKCPTHGVNVGVEVCISAVPEEWVVRG